MHILQTQKDTSLLRSPTLRALLFVGVLMIPTSFVFATVQTFSTAVSTTWTAPPDVYSVTVECWGAGGAGGGGDASGQPGGGGGGAGAYSKVQVDVTPSTSYNYTVGAKGSGSTANGTAGTNSTFNSTSCVGAGGAGGLDQNNGGTGGAGGTTAGSTGDTKYAGGGGYIGAGVVGGGGGGSGGTASNGTTATTQTGATAVTGGGPGGTGGNQNAVGTAPASGPGGGGGGGGGRTGGAKAGGDGYDGQIRLTYTTDVTFSGTLYADEGVTATTTGHTIKLAVGTSTPPTIYSTTTDSGAGTFHFSFPAGGSELSATTSIVIWVDGTTTAATVSIASGMAPISGLDLYQDRVIVRNENTTGSITIANMAIYDNANNANIPYSATTTGATSTTIFAGNELHVWTGGSFAPGGTVTINGNAQASPDGDFHIDDDASFTQDGLLTLAGSLTVDGGASFAASTDGTLFNATTTGKIISGAFTGTNAFASTTFDGSGGEWTFLYNTTVTHLNILNGTVVAPSGLLTIGGDYTNNGTFTHNDGEALLDVPLSLLTGGGILTTDWGDSNSGSIDISENNGSDDVYAITLDSSGAIYVAGSIYNSINADSDWRIRKYDANGDLATDWGDSNSGSIDISNNDGHDSARAITLDSSGAIYVAGNVYNFTNSDQDWHIRKYDANGILDTTWGDSNSGSIDIVSTDGEDWARAITHDDSGAIYVAGNYHNLTNNDYDWRIRKYDANGILTTDWGDANSGSIDISNNDGDDIAYAITLDDSGAIYVAGDYHSATNADTDWRIRKYDANGILATDWGDSNSGSIDISNNNGYESAQAITLDSSGAIYVAGYYDNLTVWDWRIRKYDANGDIATWGDANSGSIDVSNSDGSDYARAITLDDSGSIYVAGEYYNLTNADRDWRIRKYDANGDLATDWGDANSGSIDISNNGEFDSAYAITHDSSGAIYVAGDDYNSTNSDDDWRIRKYDGGTGEQIFSGTMTGSSAFGDITVSTYNGTTTFSNNASTSDFTIDSGVTVVAPSTALSIDGNYTNNGTFTHNSGTVTFSDTSPSSFTGGGDLTTDWGDSNSGSIDITNTDGWDYAYAITHDDSGAIYVAGYYYNSTNTDNDWRIRKYDANGILTTDWGDSNSGSIDISENDGHDYAYAITHDSSGAIYVAGYYYNTANTDWDWRIRKYDANGILTTDWGDSNSGSIDIASNDSHDSAYAITHDDSGAIYVAGYYNASSTGTDYDWRIRKYDANGDLATDWGDSNSGSIEISNNDGDDYARAITHDSSGAIYVAGEYYNLTNTDSDWRIRKYDANGDLATDWGDSNSGSIDISSTGGYDYAYAITLDSSGAIYITGYYYSITNLDSDWRIRKYDANGILTTDWGDSDSGSIDISSNDGNDRAYAITHDDSGAIYVAGIYYNLTNVDWDWRIRKYDANGDLATDWGDANSGSIDIINNGGDDYARAITLDSSGAIYVAGEYYNLTNTDSDWRIRKYDGGTGLQVISGSMTDSSAFNDVTLGTENVITTISSNASTTDFTILAGTTTAPSKLSIAGDYTNDGSTDLSSTDVFFDGATAQTIVDNSNTSLALDDVSFSGNSTKTLSNTHASTSDFTINTGATVVAPDTTLTIDGNYTNNGTFTHNSGNVTFTDTSPTSFTDGGDLTTDWGDSDSGTIDISNDGASGDYAHAITHDDSGAIYVAGYYYNSTNSDWDWRIRKYDANGILTTDWGDSNSGSIDVSNNDGDDKAYTITLDDSGAIYVAGVYYNLANNDYDWRIRKYDANGILTTDWGDSNSGSIDISSTDGDDYARAITLDSSGAIYVAGWYYNSANTDDDWRIRKYDANGDLATDWGDSNSGSIDIPSADGDDEAYAITLDDSGAIYVAGFYENITNADTDWRIRKYDANGDLATDWGDSNSGSIEISNNDGDDKAYAITLDSSGAIYVAGYIYNLTNADNDWRIRKYDANGLLTTDWGDSNSGSIDVSNNDGHDYAQAITLDSSGAIYVAGFYLNVTNNDYDWRIQKYDANGDLATDWGDSNSGTVGVSGNDGQDYAYTITLDDSGAIYVAGVYYNVTNTDEDWRIRKYDGGTGLQVLSGTMNDSSAFNDVSIGTENVMTTISSNASTSDLTITAGTTTVPTKLSIAGDYTNNGITDLSAADVFFSGSTAQTIVDNSNTSLALNQVSFSGNSTKTLSNTHASTSDFTINTGATVVAPATTLSIDGNYTNNGTFTHNSGEVFFDPEGWGDSNSGSIDISNNDGSDYARAITLDASGAIYVAGDYFSATNNDADWRIRKYDANGILATDWGDSNSGSIDISNDDGNDRVYAITLDASGAIYVAGNYENITNGNLDWRIRKYDANGVLSTDWGDSNSGSIDISNNDGDDSAYAITLDASGAIYVAGDYYNLTNIDRDWRIRKYDANGVLSTDWGDSNSGSIDISNNDGNDYAYAITLDASGAIYVAGNYENITNSDTDWRIRKYDPNGILSTDWGDANSGSIDISNDDGDDYAYAITLDASGAIYVSGYYYNLTNADWDWRIRKYDADGILTTDWGDANSGSIDISNDDAGFSDYARAITHDASGAIYVAGPYYNLTNADRDWRIRKYDANGILTTDWGDANSGSIDISNDDGDDYAYAITIDASGAIYAAGSYYNLTNNDADWRIRKYDANGDLATVIGDRYLSGTMIDNSAFNDLSISSFGTTAFQNNASTTNFTISDVSTTVVAPSQLSISGNYTNAGTFTHNSGEVTFDSTVQQTATGTMSGTSAFNKLTLANTSQDGATTQGIVFGASISTDDTFTMQASTSAEFLAESTSTPTNISFDGTTDSPIYLRSSVDDTQWGIETTGIQSITYTDVQDSSACTGDDINAGNTSTDSGNNDCWLFGDVATIDSNANQTFSTDDLATTISTITITDSVGTAFIKATTDIRIVIATTSVDMRFDTTDTTATFGGTASGKVSNPVSYEQDGAILVIPVDTDFALSDTLTIDNLSFTDFNATNTPTTALSLRLDGSGDLTDEATDSKTVAIGGNLALGDATSGQVSDGFNAQRSNDMEAYAFKLTPTDESITVSSLVLTLTLVKGIDNTNLTNVRLVKDINSDGAFDGGDTTVGGAGAVSAITDRTGSITFSTSFAVPSVQDYLVVIDAVDVKPTEAMTVSLTASNITSAVQTLLLLSLQPVQSAPRYDTVEVAAAERVSVPQHQQEQVLKQEAQETVVKLLGDLVGYEKPTGSGLPHDEWTTGSDAFTSDNTYATSTTADNRQSYKDFAFNIPSDNIVYGIEIEIEASASTPAGTIDIALSWDEGVSVTTVKSTSVLTSTDTIYTLGGFSDDWGHSWTPDKLSDTNFRVRIIAQPDGNTVNIDAFQVHVNSVQGGGGGGGGSEVAIPSEQNYASVIMAGTALLSQLFEGLRGWFR